MGTSSLGLGSQSERVLAVVEQEKKAMSSGDCQLYFSVLAEDDIFFPPNTTAKSGPELRRWLTEFLDHFSVVWVRWTEGAMVVMGDLAYHDYFYSMRNTPKSGGDSVLGNGKGLELFRRETDGSWMIVRNIWNAAPERVTS